MLAGALAFAGCGLPDEGASAELAGGREIPMKHARTFKVRERGGYRIVDIEASDLPERRRYLTISPIV